LSTLDLFQKGGLIGISFLAGILITFLISLGIEHNHPEYYGEDIDTQKTDKGDAKREQLSSQPTADGIFVMAPKEIHTINGFGLYMSATSYRNHINNVGDSVEINEIIFKLKPRFNEDSLLVSLELRGQELLNQTHYQEYEAHIDNVWDIAYNKPTHSLEEKKRVNIKEYYDEKYEFSIPLKLFSDKTKMFVGFGHSVKSDSIVLNKKARYGYLTFKRPYIVFAELDAISKTAEEREKEKYLKDARIFGDNEDTK
jgi:hypothetical protein